jgi:hypothetical protein
VNLRWSKATATCQLGDASLRVVLVHQQVVTVVGFVLQVASVTGSLSFAAFGP